MNNSPLPTIKTINIRSPFHPNILNGAAHCTSQKISQKLDVRNHMLTNPFTDWSIRSDIDSTTKHSTNPSADARPLHLLVRVVIFQNLGWRAPSQLLKSLSPINLHLSSCRYSECPRELYPSIQVSIIFTHSDPLELLAGSSFFLRFRTSCHLQGLKCVNARII